ncbi:Protein of unknown function [Actinokineospora iranica]|uniref:DUF3558 domain-containing protein n=1 Tax=Actinokineospora iranica TaxID=1271860 RepID=A0A1G6M4I1_9PSEU|nr:Protein of unknown function [Actinokineospora iranica]
MTLAGCGSGVDLAKTTYQRTTVPATADLGGTGDGPSGPSKTSGGDPFKAENLRKVNPCGLMDTETLTAFGEPANSRLRDYVLCSNYMKDTDGKELNFTLTLGELASGSQAKTTKTIGGLEASESELNDKTACFVTAITERDPARGITVQTGGDGPGDLCTPGRKLLETVVNRIRDDAPLLELAKGTLVDLEPCTLVPESALTPVIDDGAKPRPSGLHTCDWNAAGNSFSITFKIGTKPDDLAEAAETTPVNLGGGVTAQQKHETNSGVRCRLEWAHVPYPADSEIAEVVSIDYSRYEPQPDEDACAKTQAVAKALIPRLPSR